jgi:hypothetical protein
VGDATGVCVGAVVGEGVGFLEALGLFGFSLGCSVLGVRV